jgi:hypothetical protein
MRRESKFLQNLLFLIHTTLMLPLTLSCLSLRCLLAFEILGESTLRDLSQNVILELVDNDLNTSFSVAMEFS